MSIEQAGPITIEVEHSPDVEMLHLLDDDDVVASWPPSQPTPKYLILRNEGLDARPLQVLAVDGSDQETLSNVVWIETKLPESGTELWKRSIKLGQPTDGGALASGAGAYGSIELLVGADVEWQGRSIRLNAEGEPAMVVQPIEPGQSSVAGITHGPDGEAIVVGTQLVGNDTRPWIARVSSPGEVLDLDFGKLGDTATGVAVDPVTGRVYISGYRRTPNTGGLFDAMISARGPDGSPLWEQQWERPLPPKEAGNAADFGWGIAVVTSTEPEQAHDVVLVGESRLADLQNDLVEYRAFVRRYSSKGLLLADWMSKTPPLEQAGARCVSADPDGGLMVGGWSSWDPEVLRSGTIFFFTPLLDPLAPHLHGGKGDEVVTGLGRLPNDEIVYIADIDIADEERHDVELRAFETPLGDPLWSQTFADADKVRGNGLTVTPHGHIVVLGTETSANQSALVLAAHHP